MNRVLIVGVLLMFVSSSIEPVPQATITIYINDDNSIKGEPTPEVIEQVKSVIDNSSLYKTVSAVDDMQFVLHLKCTRLSSLFKDKSANLSNNFVYNSAIDFVDNHFKTGFFDWVSTETAVGSPTDVANQVYQQLKINVTHEAVSSGLSNERNLVREYCAEPSHAAACKGK